MGSGGSALNNATFYPMSSDDRCFAVGGVVSARSCTPSQTPTENCFRSRLTDGINFWQQMCSRLGIDRRMSTAFHVQTDGQTERINATMEQYLLVIVNHQQDDWVEGLPLAEFAANNRVLETTECTPIPAIQGMDPQMSFAAVHMKEQDQRRVSADNAQSTMQQIHKHLRIKMRWSQAVQEEGANHGRNPSSYIQEGCQVWLETGHFRTTRLTRALVWKSLGPFTVVRRISPYAYALDSPASIRIHRV